MRRVVLLLAAAALATGCAGGSERVAEEPDAPAPPATTAETAPTGGTTEPEQPRRLFTKAQLPRLAPQPADVPRGMRYVEVESGRRTLEEAGLVLDAHLAQVRGLGLVAIYDAIFESGRGERRLGARLWLYDAPGGAEQWLAKTRRDAQQFQLRPIAAPRIGDESWAAGGTLEANAVISHGFRIGNLVMVVSLSTGIGELSPPEVLAVAQRAAARVQRA